MRTRTQHTLGGVLAAVGALLLVMAPVTATAQGEYPSSITTAVEMSVESPISAGESADASVEVVTDASAAGATGDGLVIKTASFVAATAMEPAGEAEFILDGTTIETQQLQDSRADITVPASMLPVGTHTLTVAYHPASGSEFAPSQASADIVVCDGACPSQAGAEVGAGLPDTGGAAFWLLPAGALLVAAGAWLLLRRRRA